MDNKDGKQNNSLKKKDGFFKKHRLTCVILSIIPLVALSIFVPILICDQNQIIDLGSFLGGLLAYIGTSMLGLVTVYQNDKLSVANSKEQERLIKANEKLADINDKLLKLNIQYSKLQQAKFSPYVMMENLRVHEYSKQEKITNPQEQFLINTTNNSVKQQSCIFVNLKNLNEFPITKIQLKIEDDVFGEAMEASSECCFDNKKAYEIVILVPIIPINKGMKKIKLFIKFINALGFETEGLIVYEVYTNSINFSGSTVREIKYTICDI